MLTGGIDLAWLNQNARARHLIIFLGTGLGVYIEMENLEVVRALQMPTEFRDPESGQIWFRS
jgi:hypothetical protein